MTWQGDSGFLYYGAVGRAWRIARYENMTAADEANNAELASWIVEAPWAHPIWSQYALCLVHLRPLPGADRPPHLHGDYSHEFFMFALDPARKLTPAPAWNLAGGRFPFLTPPNEGYQFKAENDAAAWRRIEQLVEQIADGKLNPDTDNRATWRRLFADGHPLVRSVFEAGGS